MGQTHGRIGSVDSLSARAGCAEEILAYISGIDLDIELAGLGEDRHGCGGSLDTALSLGLGDTLHAVHSGFILHNAVDSVVAGELEHHLLETSGSAGGLVGNLQFPSHILGEVLVHTEEVSGKDCSLVAAGTAADFHHCVLAVIGIGGDEQELDILLYSRNRILDLGNLFAGHLLQFGIVLVHEDVLRGSEVLKFLLIIQTSLDDGFQFLVILVELDVLLHIRHHVGTGKLLLKRSELVLQRKYFF